MIVSEICNIHILDTVYIHFDAEQNRAIDIYGYSSFICGIIPHSISIEHGNCLPQLSWTIHIVKTTIGNFPPNYCIDIPPIQISSI